MKSEEVMMIVIKPETVAIPSCYLLYLQLMAISHALNTLKGRFTKNIEFETWLLLNIQ